MKTKSVQLYYRVNVILRILLLVCIPLVFFGVLKMLSLQLDSVARSNLMIIPTHKPVSDLESPLPSPTMPQAIYKNKKYHFQFNYDTEGVIDSATNKPLFNYYVEESGNRIILLTRDLETNNVDRVEYTLYDATTADKDKLEAWWKKHFTRDVSNLPVPQGYTTRFNETSFSSCSEEFANKFQHAFEITANDNDALMTSKVYSYYDFGRPFVVSKVDVSSGACGAFNDYALFAHIQPLKD